MQTSHNLGLFETKMKFEMGGLVVHFFIWFLASYDEINDLLTIFGEMALDRVGKIQDFGWHNWHFSLAPIHNGHCNSLVDSVFQATNSTKMQLTNKKLHKKQFYAIVCAAAFAGHIMFGGILFYRKKIRK